MENQFYGWLGQGKNKTTSSRGSGTDTASYFKDFAIRLGAEKDLDSQAKNLFKKDGKRYYILSSGKDSQASTWPAATFIGRLDNMHFILTKDTDDGKGNVWFFPFESEEKKDGILTLKTENAKIELKKIGRDSNGEGVYYPLSLEQVKKLAGDNHREFNMNSSDESIANVMKYIFDKNW